jgi:DNA-binding PucR family transcriptional regulator
LLPDPDAPGRLEALEAAARRLGVRVAVGPAVAAAEARASMAQAQATLRLVERGLLGDEPLVRSSRHVVALILAADQGLADQLVAERLAPLDELRDGVRERYERTLEAWLNHQGRLTAVAAELSVHPKTVKYRMTAIRRLFGPALDDPETRFEMQLALRAQRHSAPQPT